MIKEINENEYIYKCKAHALKRIKIDTETICARYQNREKRKKNINYKKYFDTEPLQNLLMEHQKK
jgi:hypothetical protein